MNDISPEELKEGQWTQGEVDRITPIGIMVKLNADVTGMLYKNEVYQELSVGDKLKVYIKKIREDGKIDLALQKGGYKNAITDSSESILNSLQAAGGFLPFTDHSDPEDILQQFHISKKKFKEAIGALYKAHKLEITEEGIRAV